MSGFPCENPAAGEPPENTVPGAPMPLGPVPVSPQNARWCGSQRHGDGLPCLWRQRLRIPCLGAPMPLGPGPVGPRWRGSQRHGDGLPCLWRQRPRIPSQGLPCPWQLTTSRSARLTRRGSLVYLQIPLPQPDRRKMGNPPRMRTNLQVQRLVSSSDHEGQIVGH